MHLLVTVHICILFFSHSPQQTTAKSSCQRSISCPLTHLTQVLFPPHSSSHCGHSCIYVLSFLRTHSLISLFLLFSLCISVCLSPLARGNCESPCCSPLCTETLEDSKPRSATSFHLNVLPPSDCKLVQAHHLSSRTFPCFSSRLLPQVYFRFPLHYHLSYTLSLFLSSFLSLPVACVKRVSLRAVFLSFSLLCDIPLSGRVNGSIAPGLSPAHSCLSSSRLLLRLSSSAGLLSLLFHSASVL